MKMFELQHPFFEPVWRRVLTVTICLGWAIFEFVTREPFWGILFGTTGAFAVYQFFIAAWPKNDPDQNKAE